MAIRKSVAVSKILERAVERLHSAPQTGAAEMVVGARQVAKLLEGLEAIAQQRNPTETREAHALRVAKAAEQLLVKVKDAEARDNTTRTNELSRPDSTSANNGPNRCHQNRMVSWLTSTPRSCSRSSTFRSESGNRKYNITARRMVSGDVLKLRKGMRFVMQTR